MKGQYMTLEQAIQHLHRHGKYDEFTEDGLPKVDRVRNLMGNSDITRQQIDEAWFRLYGFSTNRDKKGGKP